MKLQPTHPTNTNLELCQHSFPTFPYLFLFFSRLLHHCVRSQAQPKLPAGHLRSPSKAGDAQRCPCKPHLDLQSPEEASTGKFLRPLEHKQQLPESPLLRVALADSVEMTQHLAGGTPAPCTEGQGQHLLSPTSGGCTGGEFQVLGGRLRRAGLAQGLGSLVLADGHRLGQDLLGQTLEEPGTGAFPHLGVQGMGWHPCLGGMLGADVAAFIPCITRVCLQQATLRM